MLYWEQARTWHRRPRRREVVHGETGPKVQCKSEQGYAGLLALVGVVNVPIIYFSVKWWNTLHQGASVSLAKAPSMATPMLLGMLLLDFVY